MELVTFNAWQIRKPQRGFLFDTVRLNVYLAGVYKRSMKKQQLMGCQITH
jgi:hypothetical protein